MWVFHLLKESLLQQLFGDFLGGIGGGAGAIALVGLVAKIFPGIWEHFATATLQSANLEKLAWDSQANKLVHRVADEEIHYSELKETLVEIQKDTIKNTLMSLMASPRDESDRVRYEMGKLEKLDADCWVMLAAADYLKEHHYGGNQ